ncbi:MAG: DUF2336 domain-containing protein, partial [Terriglobia bacterium]
MEARALVELSAALANVTPAPPATLSRLAHHENPTVAAPVLLKSPALTNSDLVEISSRRSQQHLVAIASRPSLDEAVTDTFLRYAGKDASRAVVKNPAARFTAQGYAALLATAERDDIVAESLGSRPDLPEEMLHSLLARTSDTVRARLLKSTAPQARERVQAALASTPAQARQERSASDDYAEAKAAVVVLNKGGKLSDSSVNRFAMRREYPNVIAALTLLSGA